MQASLTAAVGFVPPVDELLDVDREFRSGFAAGTAILHTMRGDRRYTALYSESMMARSLGRDHDWVILDLEVPGPNLRWTAVTEFRGVMKGKRVIRGREVECFQHYHRGRGGRRPSRRSPRAA